MLYENLKWVSCRPRRVCDHGTFSPQRFRTFVMPVINVSFCQAVGLPLTLFEPAVFRNPVCCCNAVPGYLETVETRPTVPPRVPQFSPVTRTVRLPCYMPSDPQLCAGRAVGPPCYMLSDLPVGRLTRTTYHHVGHITRAVRPPS